ncbi:MAG TPA: hypothetical protein VKK81_08485, partial [Candidatus Binatia bacterium]|nr:hypothetical protein [Candidatus Binatia bacterium]
MWTSSAPIWRLKPTISVNMIAARRRVSACRVLVLSAGIAAIIVHALGICQIVRTPALRHATARASLDAPLLI